MSTLWRAQTQPCLLNFQSKCSPESHYPFFCTPTELDTKQDFHPGHFFCSPLTSSSWQSTCAKAPSSQAEEPQAFPLTNPGSLQTRSSCDNHISTCSRGAAGWPGSMSHPRSCAVPQPWGTCAVQMDTERAAAAAPCVLPACSLCSQFVCLPQPFVQDLWMSAAKNMEKLGKWRWKISGNMCKEGRRNAVVKSPFAAGWGLLLCMNMGTMLTPSMSPSLWPHQTPFHFQLLLFQLPGLIPLTKPWHGPCLSKEEKPQSLETQSPSIQ